MIYQQVTLPDVGAVQMFLTGLRRRYPGRTIDFDMGMNPTSRPITLYYNIDEKQETCAQCGRLFIPLDKKGRRVCSLCMNASRIF